MTTSHTFISHTYFAIFLWLLQIFGLLIWAWSCQNKRRCSSGSDRCSNKKKRKGCSDDCSGSGSRSGCRDRSFGNWFGWCKDNGRRVNQSTYYVANFLIFVLGGLLAHYNIVEGLVFIVGYVFIIEVGKWCSKWMRRQLCREKWYQLLVVVFVGYLIGLGLAGLSCWFEPPTYCCAVSESIGYTINYKNSVPLSVATLTR